MAAVIFTHFLPSQTLTPRLPHPPISPPPLYSSSGARICCSSSSMDPQIGGPKKFMDFPYVSDPHRDLMVELASTVETRLGSFLLPCTLPPDVQYYQNQTGTAQATLHIRSGLKSSPVDFILGSWIHSELPTGGELNITSLSTYLNSSSDAPNFLLELIQSSPTSLILILDLPPRKDLVVDTNYLKTFYEDTQLDRHRQLLSKLPEVTPYVSSSLYIRCLVSPTAILVCIDTKNGGGRERLDEIIGGHVSGIAKEVLGVWLDRCAFGEREVGESERACLAKRDQIVKTETIEIDLGSSLPRLFGPEVVARVLGAIREVFSA